MARPDPAERGALAVVLALALFLLCASRLAEPDLWGHVLYGRELLATGRVPATATHTFTAPEHPWINHEVLAEIALAAAAGLGGSLGLVALKALLGALLLALLIAAARARGASLGGVALLVLLVAINLAPGWSCRPQIFGWLFFLIQLLALEAAFDREAPRRAWLWLVPPLFAVWANTHGSFVAGYAVLGVYLGGRALEALWRRGRGGVGDVARCALVLGASGAATLLNPYGADLATWLAADLAPARPEITEWQSLSPTDLRFVPFAALVALVVSTLVRGRGPRYWPLVAVLAVTGWQSVVHLRHIPFFALASAVWLAGRFGAAAAPAPEPVVPATGGGARAYAWPAVLGLALLGAIGWRGLKVDKRYYPVEALQYMADRNVAGRLVVHFDWAQYALAALVPATTVAFDGRFRTCYPQEIADMHFDFILGEAGGRRWRSPASPPIDGARVLGAGNPDLVLLNRRYPRSVAVMQQAQGDWVLLYQDALAQLWGRRDRYDDPASPVYLPGAERSIGDRVQAGLVDWPALPVRRREAGAGPA